MKRALIAGLAVVLAGCRGYGPGTGEKWRQLVVGDRPEAARAGLEDPSPSIRSWSAISLARMGDLDATHALMAHTIPTSESSSYVRSTAIVCLRVLGDKRALPALRRAAEDPVASARADAARALGDLGGADDISVLSGMSQKDADPSVRLEAVWGMGRLGGDAALAGLVAALADSDDSVTFAAHSSLVKLTGQQLSPDQHQWEEWLKSQSPAK